MSWSARETRSPRRTNDDFVRRMVNLPRNLLGGFSRTMGRRRNNIQNQPFRFANPESHHEINIPWPIPDDFAFLSTFEHQHGSNHPFFYACKFGDAMKIAEDEKKFVFVYLHSPSHPFSASFCRETLCSELVTQFLDRNFVSWGALKNQGEGLQMAAALKPASFPFCAVAASGNGDNMAVLQQIEGPVSAAELVEILQRTMEEQGLAFHGATKLAEKEKSRIKAREEEKIREDRTLREEQDAAYLAVLHTDREKERVKNFEKVQKPAESLKRVNYDEPKKNLEQIHSSRGNQISAAKESRYSEPTTNRTRDSRATDTTQILIRFPNGERMQKSFSTADRIRDIYSYIDSSGVMGIRSYRLISSFPRRIYGVDQLGISLKDAGLYPRASLFVELL